MKTVDLAILNYNGKKHLEHLLPTAVCEAKHSKHNCRVVVVDNGSRADELEWIQKEFPSVLLWTSPVNDYLFSYNKYAKNTESDFMIFLNNDLILKQNFVDPLIYHYKEKDVFAVGATSRDWDDQEYTCGPAFLAFQKGWYSWQFDTTKQSLQNTFFTSGGFMAVNRKKFLELNGFDELYRPAYCEDVDLCFRAWRCGWRCIFEPKSVVLHRETASWQNVGNNKLSKMQLQNALLFQWSSLPMRKAFWIQRKSLIKIFLGELINFKLTWLTAYFSALGKWKLRQKKTHRAPANEKELSAISLRLSRDIF